MSSKRLPNAPSLDLYQQNVDDALTEVASLAPADDAERGDPAWPSPASRRRLSLEPEFIREPPRTNEERPRKRGMLRIVLVAVVITGVGFAALTFLWPVENLPWSQRTASTTQGLGSSGPLDPPVTRSMSPTARMGRPPLSGQGLPLGLTLQGDVPSDTMIVVSGLLGNMALSVGEPFGAHGWRLPASRIDEALVHAPPGFVGGIDLSVEIHLNDGTVAGRKKVRLDWTAPASKEPVTARAAPPPAPAPPPPASQPSYPSQQPAFPSQQAARAPAQTAMAPAAPSPPPVATAPPPPPFSAAPQQMAAPAAPPLRQLDAEETSLLVKRGEELLAARDIAAARLALERAAEAGDARAALALASTYDPAALRSLGVVGVSPDPEKARAWYERAVQYGSAEAARRLTALNQSGR